MSDELIERLSRDLKPVPRLAVARRLAIGLGVGAVVSAVLTRATLGFRPDMTEAMGEAMFWVKLAYTAAIAGLGCWIVERLARPAGDARRRTIWLLLPFAAVAMLAAWQLMQAAPGERMHKIMGGSADACPWCVLLFATPPMLGLVWAVRGLAPTRLRLTGAMLGLAAGGAGAAAYALHCDEMTAPFLAVWYTLGILGAGAIGALVGPRALRW